MIMDMRIDKKNGDIAFNDEHHIYFNLKDTSKKYISVTTLIHKFEPEFDKDFWSAYKALEKVCDSTQWSVLRRELLSSKKFNSSMLEAFDINELEFNKTHQDILDAWYKENLASTDRGSKIHYDLEQSFYKQGKDISLQKYGVGGKFTCIEGNTNLNDNGLFPEYLIHYESPDGKLNLAGQIDLLVKEDNQFTIIDWKGLPLDTPIPTPEGWVTMGELSVGDKVFDKDGEVCTVLHKSEVHYNPCHKITFTNGDEVVSDSDHRWLVSLLPDIDKSRIVMTTKEIDTFLASNPNARLVIDNCSPLNLPDKDIPDEFELDEASLSLIIKASLRASIEQRYSLLKILYGRYIKEFGDGYVITSIRTLISELLRTFGVQVSDEDYTFHSTIFEENKTDFYNYREILNVEQVPTVATQCIEVDSPSHTYLCTDKFIVTHNTNKEIKRKSYFNQRTKTSDKLKYPLSDLDSCNYSTYNMQLSTYAWMLQHINPSWECKELILVHFDHQDQMTVYKMDYLKEHVERMINYWRKEAVLQSNRNKRKRIEY